MTLLEHPGLSPFSGIKRINGYSGRGLQIGPDSCVISGARSGPSVISGARSGDYRGVGALWPDRPVVEGRGQEEESGLPGKL